MYLSAFLSDLAKRGTLDATIFGPLMKSIAELQNAISDLDKLATTPNPPAYSFHIRLTVWAYLLFLPFQVYTYIGWVTIPASAIASIIFLGLLELGGRIEKPFGYNPSDVDLDTFALNITQQLAEVTAVSLHPLYEKRHAHYSIQFPPSIPSSHIVMSSLNQPFLPSLLTTANEILGLEEKPPIATTMGFAAAFSEPKQRDPEQRPKSSVRDIEIALAANWRAAVVESERRILGSSFGVESESVSEVAVVAI